LHFPSRMPPLRFLFCIFFRFCAQFQSALPLPSSSLRFPLLLARWVLLCQPRRVWIACACAFHFFFFLCFVLFGLPRFSVPLRSCASLVFQFASNCELSNALCVEACGCGCGRGKRQITLGHARR
jgi:hypothetical protein